MQNSQTKGKENQMQNSHKQKEERFKCKTHINKRKRESNANSHKQKEERIKCKTHKQKERESNAKLT